ncbi:craniofacial development protein 2-like [Diorhabda sublineata]|uniref:craniofacial development protein 2-like n=1 Tax=Diorhabda sublineata TaxID=1163346 RepID=UPI0024E0497D|nr:craniofacial development protein 2-like [Diorhabda sublineata]
MCGSENDTCSSRDLDFNVNSPNENLLFNDATLYNHLTSYSSNVPPNDLFSNEPPPSDLHSKLSNWAASRTVTLASETGRSIDDDTARKRKKRVWKENIVRLGSWNITSWSNKDYEVVVEIEKNKIDFCALSETKKKGNGSQRYQNYILFYSGVDMNLRARGGVGLLVNKKFEKDIKEVQYISHSIIQIIVELANERTHLLSIYAPDVSKPKEEREAFFDALQATSDKIPSKDKVFIMGDFNSRIGNTVIPGIMHSFNEGAVNDNGDILIDVCALNELRINNTYFDHKKQQNLDDGSVSKWEEYKSKKDLPSLEDMYEFLRSRSDLLERLELNKLEQGSK